MGACGHPEARLGARAAERSLRRRSAAFADAVPATSKSHTIGKWSENRTWGTEKRLILIWGLCRMKSISRFGDQLGNVGAPS